MSLRCKFYIDFACALLYNQFVLDEDNLCEEVFLSLTCKAMPVCVRVFLSFQVQFEKIIDTKESSAWTAEANERKKNGHKIQN